MSKHARTTSSVVAELMQQFEVRRVRLEEASSDTTEKHQAMSQALSMFVDEQRGAFCEFELYLRHQSHECIQRLIEIDALVNVDTFPGSSSELRQLRHERKDLVVLMQRHMQRLDRLTGQIESMRAFCRDADVHDDDE